MTPEERKRLLDVSYRSKKGMFISPDDSAFIQDLFTRHPGEYVKVQREGAQRAVGELRSLAGSRTVDVTEES